MQILDAPSEPPFKAAPDNEFRLKFQGGAAEHFVGNFKQAAGIRTNAAGDTFNAEKRRFQRVQVGHLEGYFEPPYLEEQHVHSAWITKDLEVKCFLKQASTGPAAPPLAMSHSSPYTVPAPTPFMTSGLLAPQSVAMNGTPLAYQPMAVSPTTSLQQLMAMNGSGSSGMPFLAAHGSGPLQPSNMLLPLPQTTVAPPAPQMAAQVMGTSSEMLEYVGQTHDWAFGALAELVDNAVDAKATRIGVSVRNMWGTILDFTKDKDETTPILVVEDNGEGMDHAGIKRMLTLGHKPDSNANRIGHYGVGFKTGTMRLGNDALVLSKHFDPELQKWSAVIGFLSKNYTYGTSSVETPVVALDRYLKVDTSIMTEEHANDQFKAIEGHSPFTREMLYQELGRIHTDTNTGTRIYVWNLQADELLWTRGGRGKSNIIVASKLVRENNRGVMFNAEIPLDWDLREYLSLMYLRPRVKLCVQGSETEAVNLTNKIKAAGRAKEYQQQFPSHANPDVMVTCTLTVGLLEEEKKRCNCGINYYHNNRLIRSWRRGMLAAEKQNAFGIVGTVDTTDVLMPKNTKQDYDEKLATKALDKWVDKCVGQYFESMEENAVAVTTQVDDGEVDDECQWIQCSDCMAWRRVYVPEEATQEKFDEMQQKAKWFCWEHPNLTKAALRCNAPSDKSRDDEVTLNVSRDGERVAGIPIPQPAPSARHANVGGPAAAPTTTTTTRVTSKAAAPQRQANGAGVSGTGQAPPRTAPAGGPSTAKAAGVARANHGTAAGAAPARARDGQAGQAQAGSTKMKVTVGIKRESSSDSDDVRVLKRGR